MTAPTCDARLAFVTPAYAGECSGDLLSVWHGLPDPAIGCGKHANASLPLALFRGHRVRLGSALPWADSDLITEVRA